MHAWLWLCSCLLCLRFFASSAAEIEPLRPRMHSLKRVPVVSVLAAINMIIATNGKRILRTNQYQVFLGVNWDLSKAGSILFSVTMIIWLNNRFSKHSSLCNKKLSCNFRTPILSFWLSTHPDYYNA